MTDDSARGRFIWHELGTPDPNGASRFYSTALGWKVETGEADSSHSTFAAASGPLAGCGEQSPSAVSRWTPFITVSNIDAALRDASALGASVVIGPTAIERAGRYSVLTDPQGATFGLYSDEDFGPERDAGYGEFSWHELATVDCRAAFEFYRELFGWENVSEHDMGPMGVYLIFGRGGKQIGGMFNKGAKSGEPSWLSYVRVEDLPGTVDKIKAERGSVVTEPMEVPGGDWVAQLLDPYGAAFAVHAVAADVKREFRKAGDADAAEVETRAASTEPATADDAEALPAEAGARNATAGGAGTVAKTGPQAAGSRKKASKTTKARGKTAKKSAAAKKPAAKKPAAKKAGGKTSRKKTTKKKTAKKKIAKKKTAKKKAAKSRTVSRKAAKKKATAKKGTAKKSAAKRSGAKKPGKKTPTKKTGKKVGKKTTKKAAKKKTSKKTSKKTNQKTKRKTGKTSGKKASKRSGASAGKKKTGKQGKKAKRRAGRR